MGLKNSNKIQLAIAHSQSVESVYMASQLISAKLIQLLCYVQVAIAIRGWINVRLLVVQNRKNRKNRKNKKKLLYNKYNTKHFISLNLCREQQRQRQRQQQQQEIISKGIKCW